jgi:hypothetical protein
MQRQTTPRTVPLSEPARQSRKKTKKQLRSTTVSTPRLLMAAIKSITSVPILGITKTPHSQLTSHQLLVLPFFRIIIHLPTLPRSCPYFHSRLLTDSRLPVLISTSGTISLFRERSAPPRCIVHFVLSLRLWVYHRDFGATPSVIYGKSLLFVKDI